MATGKAQLDRERSYYAALLALDTRGYAITEQQPVHAISARYHLDLQDHAEDIAWRLRVREDAGIALHVTPPLRLVSRWGRRWSARLERTHGEFRCKDLDWLRREAQDRGLLNGAELSTIAPHGPEIAALIAERQRVPRYFYIAGVGGSSALFVMGASMVAVGAAVARGGCEKQPGSTMADCERRDTGAALLTFGGTFAAVGLVGAAVSLPRLIVQRRRLREIGAELRKLRAMELGLDGATGRFALSLRARF